MFPQLVSRLEGEREALSAYYADMAAYVQESRQQMKLSQNPVIPEFPQMNTYLNQKEGEKDLDHDGTTDRVDIGDQGRPVQLTHYLDKGDGVAKKTIRSGAIAVRKIRDKW